MYIAGIVSPDYKPLLVEYFDTFSAAKNHVIGEMRETAESTLESEDLSQAAEDAGFEAEPFSYLVSNLCFFVVKE